MRKYLFDILSSWQVSGEKSKDKTLNVNTGCHCHIFKRPWRQAYLSVSIQSQGTTSIHAVTSILFRYCLPNTITSDATVFSYWFWLGSLPLCPSYMYYSDSRTTKLITFVMASSLKNFKRNFVHQLFILFMNTNEKIN